MGRGKLLVIGTPIGNLSDLSPRAIEALKECAVLLCEDTRHTRKLLNHFGITTPSEAFHEHNEDAKSPEVIARLERGDVVGLVSDAGMPILSDPGFKLLRAARERGITVEPVPGPFAGILALVASGLAPTPFAFYGFAPHRKNDRVSFYERIAKGAITAIVYESPQRIVESLRDAHSVFGDVEITVAREMTKIHEEFLHGSLQQVIENLASREDVKGELTVVFAAAVPKAEISAGPEQIAREFQRLREEGIRRSDAVKLLADRYGVNKNELYRMLLEE